MTDENRTPPDRNQRLVWVVLAVITFVGAWFRMVRLGDAALRADTITFWNICSSDLSMREIFQQWTQLGHTGHFPFANAFIKGFLDFFNLPLTHSTLRLPSALWGTITVPVIYGFTRRLTGPGIALLAAAILAFNPYHIQICREAYFYPPMVLGATLLMWGTVWAIQSLSGDVDLNKRFVLLLGAGSFLVTYSIPAGWLMFLLCAPCILLVIGLSYWRTRKVDRTHIVAIGVVVLVLAPFVFASWGFSQFEGHTGGGSVRTEGLKALAYVGGSPWTLLADWVKRFGWGDTPVRMAWGWCAAVLALVGVMLRARRCRVYLMLMYFVVGAIVLFLMARPQLGMLFEVRYTVSAIPAWVLMLATGIVTVPSWAFAGAIGVARWVTVILAVFALGLWLEPAYLSTKLSGKPAPYREIQSWVDRELPRGTPVLVDRWFEPWNELKVYNSTNVHFTFTIPNEPVDTFKKYRWRDTAKQFFAQNPDAAYLEIARSYWDVPEIGPWKWPSAHFARKVKFINEAGLRLRHMGMAARGDFYSPDTNKVEVELFYNTPEDIVERAAADGQSVAFTYGDGWGYTKLWPQTQDFRDWRILQDASVLRVFNLQAEPLDVQLTMTAVAVNGDKHVKVAARFDHTFVNGQLGPWQMGPVSLAPGLNELLVEDVNRSTASVPLLVSNIRVEPMSSVDAGASPEERGEK